MKSRLTILALTIMPALAVGADGSSFFVKFTSCTMPISALVLSEKSLHVTDGKPYTLMCFRSGADVRCSFELTDGIGENDTKSMDYKVVFDYPPLLHFSTQSGSEYIAVNADESAAALVSRALGEQYLGAKVCHGVYLTAEEVRAR